MFEVSAVRGPGEVALYVGLVAGWEVPAMLILPRFAHLLPRSAMIALGALLYSRHLVALPYLSDTPFLWVMPVFAGVGGAAIRMLPIPCYQDLPAGRPGTAAAMPALQKLVTDVLTAAAFDLGTAIGGFETVALRGTAIALSGALDRFLVDHSAWFPARTRGC